MTVTEIFIVIYGFSPGGWVAGEIGIQVLEGACKKRF